MMAESSGDAAPQPMPLMLLPGTLCDAALFAPMVARLDGRREIIVGEMSGHDTAAALATALLARAPPRFALAGFSLGGIVAIAVAVQAPDRVAGLALIASTARPVPPAEQIERRQRLAEMPSAARAVAGSWEEQVATRHRDDLGLRDLMIAMADRCGLAVLRSQTEVALTRPDNRPRVSTLAMPALVLAGDEDRTNPPSVQQELAALLPDAALALIPGAGHYLPLEAPAESAAALERWLTRVDARGWADARPRATLSQCPYAAAGRR